MKFRTEAGGASLTNFVNLALRGLQFLVGLVILILYAVQPSYHRWAELADIKFGLGTAAGALAVATAPFMAVIPFFVGYGIVAWAFLWDLIVMAVNAATFAYFKARFPWGHDGDVVESELRRLKVSKGHIQAMRAATILDLIAMLLWIITLVMSIVLLIFGRVRGSRANKY